MKRDILCLFCLLLVFCSPSNADDWTVGPGGKPARHSLSAEYGPTSADILWQGGLNAVIAQQAVIEGNILVMARIQNLSDVLHGTLIVAHNFSTGDTLWTKDLPVDFPSTDWRNRVSAIRDGKVYATRSGNDNWSYLYALDATTGIMLWRSQDSINESSTEGASFAPNGDLVIGNFTNVTRINAADGNRVWRTARTSPTSGGSQAAVFGPSVYLWEAGAQGPVITTYNLTTGQRLYSTPGIGGGFVQQVGPFVGPDRTVYAPRTQNNIATDFLVAYADIDTGFEEKWRIPLGYVPFATFGVGPDGSVYSYTRDKEIIRIEPQTGTILDTSEVIVTDFFQPRMAIDANGNVFLTNGGFSQGAVYSFNPDLTLRWMEAVPSVNVGGPAIGENGTMVVCGVGTNVRAYRGGPVNVPEPSGVVASQFHLEQNYPNPFNPSTVIEFRVSSFELVTLKVYDLLGREIATLVNEMKHPGAYSVHWDARGFASGTYIYRIQAGDYVQAKKLMYLK